MFIILTLINRLMLIKKINIKNLVYFFFQDTINIKDFDPDTIKIKTKS